MHGRAVSLHNFKTCSDLITLNEVQLLLAERRTALCYLRIGIAIFAFPLSVLSILIATSRSYDASEVLHLLVSAGTAQRGAHCARRSPDRPLIPTHSSLRPVDRRIQAPPQPAGKVNGMKSQGWSRFAEIGRASCRE